MCRLLCVLSVVALSLSFVNSWDIAITYGDQLEFYQGGNKTTFDGARFRELTALAHDAVHHMLLFVDRQSDNASIFSFHINTKKYQPLVKRKLYENIQGIAYDPITNRLFWTDTVEKSIFWMSLVPGAKNNAYGNVLIKLDSEVPRDIVVDSCRGNIYWTNTNTTRPTIEMARLDGTGRKVIVNTDIFMPVSIVVDHRSGRLFWADDKEGIHFSIESSDLLGGDRKTVHRGRFHQPNKLTVSKDSLYWIEWGYNSVWKLPKNASENDEPETVFSFINKMPLPFGIVANYNIQEQTEGIGECGHLAKLALNETAVNEEFSTITAKEGLYCLHGEAAGRVCRCSPGYAGERCEVSLCQNFCLHGDCKLAADGQPFCRCANGFVGARCDVDLCRHYCLNDASCSVDEVTREARCRCLDGFEGARCEATRVDNSASKMAGEDRNAVPANQACNCTADPATPVASVSSEVDLEPCSSWDPVRDPLLGSLGALSGALGVACACLVTKIMQLKKRPRIKKRIIVQKNVTPLTSRPDQCEITIENCCNMNICETPCFEPRSTIRPGLLNSKAEEKSNLIANMELPEDY